MNIPIKDIITTTKDNAIEMNESKWSMVTFDGVDSIIWSSCLSADIINFVLEVLLTSIDIKWLLRN